MAMIMLTIHIHLGFHLLPTLFVLLTLLSALSGSSFPWRSPGHRPGTEDGSTGRGEVRLQFVSAKDVATVLPMAFTSLQEQELCVADICREAVIGGTTG